MFWMFFITEVQRRARDSVSEGRGGEGWEEWARDDGVWVLAGRVGFFRGQERSG